jgi:hypothetical protein
LLDIIGKASPGTFRPALQIDAGVKSLIEAPSGRWSYAHDWRDKRTTWFYVANALSFLITTLQPTARDDDDLKILTSWNH